MWGTSARSRDEKDRIRDWVKHEISYVWCEKCALHWRSSMQNLPSTGELCTQNPSIANKTCVLQIAPVCMTENLGTKNLTLFSIEMLIHYLPVKVIVCSRILSVYPSNTQSLT